ncbi:MAG: universal stress protein [Maribacter sp.]|nr:universal stress protein [Maribacter sp.]
MKNVLIPTDFSNNSINALNYALVLFKKIPCNFYIVHVLDFAERRVEVIANGPSLLEASPHKMASAVNELDKILQTVRDTSQFSGHRFFTQCYYGFFVEVIRKQVIDKKIDLILLGTKGASGLKKFIIGSNAGDVITKVRCNALIIPENAPPQVPKKIVFPSDFNFFYTHAILQNITEIVNLCKASISILNVGTIQPQLSAMQRHNKAELQDYMEEIFPSSHDFQRLKGPKVTDTIQDFVSNKNIDMILMVAKNLNFLQQLLFTTTIKKVSFHTKVPVWVLHD